MYNHASEYVDLVHCLWEIIGLDNSQSEKAYNAIQGDVGWQPL